MAMLTRFTSTTNTTPGIDRVNMDPGAASQAATAAYQGIAQENQANQALVGDINNFIADRVAVAKKNEAKLEKVDSSYLTNSKANIELDFNDAYHRSLSDLKVGGAFDQSTDQLLQTVVQPWVEKAPNQATRDKLINQLVGFRASTLKRAQNEQFRVNSDAQFTDLLDYTNRSVVLAVQGPEAESKVLDTIDEKGANMLQNGVRADAVEKAVKNSKRLVQEAVAMKFAETNPFEALDAATNGKLDNIKAGTVNSVITRANTKIAGLVKQSEDDLNNLNLQMISGQAIPEDAITRIDSAVSLAAKTNNTKLMTSATNTGKIAGMSRELTAATYQQLKEKQAKFSIELAKSPNPDMKEANLVQKMLENRIKTIEDDPFKYGDIQDKGKIIPDLPSPDADLNNQDVKNVIYQRAAMAEQYSAAMGIPVAPLYKHEMEAIASNFDSLKPSEQEKQIQFLASFGGDSAALIADKIAPMIKAKDGTKYKALAPTIAIMGKDPKMATEILKGQQLMSHGQYNVELSAQDISDATSSVFMGTFADDPNKASQFVEAAKALTVSQLAAEGRTSGNSVTLKGQQKKFTENLAKVSNSVKLEQDNTRWWSDKDYSTIAPRWGMTGRDMRREILGLTDDVLNQFGNGSPVITGMAGQRVPLPASKVSEYQFVAAEQMGKYMVMRNGRHVETEDGRPYIFNFDQYLKSNGR